MPHPAPNITANKRALAINHFHESSSMFTGPTFPIDCLHCFG
jgi:hypothetical protein